MTTANIVICGAGIAGISTAYHLAVHHRIKNIILIDERAPLTLTSNKSTDGYHNWHMSQADNNHWTQFMGRSLDLLEALAATSGNHFNLGRQGYLYVTTDPDRVASMQTTATTTAKLGTGELRVHPNNHVAYQPNMPASPKAFHTLPTGADFLTDPKQLRRQFPFLSKKAIAALHVRRAGWFDSGKLGNWLLDQALAHGIQLKRDRVEGVGSIGGKVRTIFLASGERIDTDSFVLAVGPHLREMGLKMGVDLPVAVELQGKIVWRENAGIIPPNTPLILHHDPIHIPWNAINWQTIPAIAQTEQLAQPLPPNIYLRPLGNKEVAITWTPQPHRQPYPLYPMPFPSHFANLLMRGMSQLIPGLSVYHEQLEQVRVTGGYTCHAPDNHPLIGSLPIAGAYVIGALAGVGTMAAPAAGELLANHITQTPLPPFALDFHPNRYADSPHITI